MIQPARNPSPLAIYGAGGHGRVVADAAAAAGLTVLGFLDDHPSPAESPVRLLDPDDPRLAAAVFHVAIGDNRSRQRVANRLLEQGRTLATVIHPDATLSPEAILGRGVYVGPQAVVGPGVNVGDLSLINSAAVVEHDCLLAQAVHAAPGSLLAGGVHVGEATLVGLGAKILPGIHVGRRCIVGAGAVVTRHAGDGLRLVGIPARASQR